MFELWIKCLQLSKHETLIRKRFLGLLKSLQLKDTLPTQLLAAFTIIYLYLYYIFT